MRPEQLGSVGVFRARSGIAATMGWAHRREHPPVLPEAYRDLFPQREGERIQGRAARTRIGPRLRSIAAAGATASPGGVVRGRAAFACR